MKNLFAGLILVLFTAACTPQSDSMRGGMMDGMQCQCRQEMMEDGCKCCADMMKDGKMQCPMMQGEAKGGKKCACCQKMTQDQSAQPADHEPAPAAGVSKEDHNKHHPAQ